MSTEENDFFKEVEKFRKQKLEERKPIPESFEGPDCVKTKTGQKEGQSTSMQYIEHQQQYFPVYTGSISKKRMIGENVTHEVIISAQAESSADLFKILGNLVMTTRGIKFHKEKDTASSLNPMIG